MTTATHVAVRTAHALSRVLALLALTAIAYVMVVVVWSVTLRELDQPPVRGIVEYAELAMTAGAFLALAEAERRRQHVSVEVLVQRLRGRARTVVLTVAGVASIAVLVLLAWASTDALLDSLSRGEFKLGLVRLPMWPARLAVAAGVIGLALEHTATLVSDLHDRAPSAADPTTAPSTTQELT